MLREDVLLSILKKQHSMEEEMVAEEVEPWSLG